MVVLTKTQVAERNLKEARKVLSMASATLRASGLRVVRPSAWTDDGKTFFVSIDTNAGKGSQMVFDDCSSKLDHLTLVESGYTEGLFDWASDTYIKPTIWAKFSA